VLTTPLGAAAAELLEAELLLEAPVLDPVDAAWPVADCDAVDEDDWPVADCDAEAEADPVEEDCLDEVGD